MVPNLICPVYFIDLQELLRGGGNVVVAEGYMWEIERRGYLQFGRFGPEVVLDHPWVLKGLHEEFAHAGSDVIEAFTVMPARTVTMKPENNLGKNIAFTCFLKQ